MSGRGLLLSCGASSTTRGDLSRHSSHIRNEPSRAMQSARGLSPTPSNEVVGRQAGPTSDPSSWVSLTVTHRSDPARVTRLPMLFIAAAYFNNGGEGRPYTETTTLQPRYHRAYLQITVQRSSVETTSSSGSDGLNHTINRRAFVGVPIVVQACDIWWPQQGIAAGFQSGLEADRLPCSGGGGTQGCVGQPGMATRRGVNKLFLLRVQIAEHIPGHFHTYTMLSYCSWAFALPRRSLADRLHHSSFIDLGIGAGQVNEAFERAVESSGIMPLNTFREEKARVALASSNRTSSIGVGTSGGVYPVPYKVARKLASQWRGQLQVLPFRPLADLPGRHPNVYGGEGFQFCLYHRYGEMGISPFDEP
eukprot:669791-Pyramimonas_sp.AAC.1